MKSSANPGDLVEVHFGKIYKGIIVNNIRMFPSDPTGSLDDFFSENFINYLNRGFNLWKRL